MNASFILGFLSNFKKLRYLYAGIDNPFPTNADPVVQEIMLTQRKLGEQRPSGTSVSNRNSTFLTNVAGMASLALTLNVIDTPQALPVTYFKQVGGQSNLWEDIFSGKVDLEGMDPITFGLKHWNLPFDPTIWFYIAMKRVYYRNLKIVFNVMMDGTTTSQLNRCVKAELNATPMTVFTRVRAINNKILGGIYDDYALHKKDGGKGIMVQEFLLSWAFIFGWVYSRKYKKGEEVNYEKLFRGTAKKTLRRLMTSLGIAGRDEGGFMPLNMRGKNILVKYKKD